MAKFTPKTQEQKNIQKYVDKILNTNFTYKPTTLCDSYDKRSDNNVFFHIHDLFNKPNCNQKCSSYPLLVLKEKLVELEEIKGFTKHFRHLSITKVQLRELTKSFIEEIIKTYIRDRAYNGCINCQKKLKDCIENSRYKSADSYYKKLSEIIHTYFSDMKSDIQFVRQSDFANKIIENYIIYQESKECFYLTFSQYFIIPKDQDKLEETMRELKYKESIKNIDFYIKETRKDIQKSQAELKKYLKQKAKIQLEYKESTMLRNVTSSNNRC